MSMNNQASIERKIQAFYRVLLIIWAAQMMALAVFFLLALFVFRSQETGDLTMFWMLAALSIILVAVSFVVKQKFFAQAIEKQNIAAIQQGQIVAIALCEAAALFGLLARAITGTRYFYLPMAVAALGLLLHFPRREALMAASFKNRI
jgi:hypothetical protein